jgi:hypothetical protein
MRYALPLILLIVLTFGCASQRAQMEAAGYDPAYIDGWEDGWGSGYVAAGHTWYKFHKDTHRFETDSQYAQGWTDAYNTAKGRYEAVGRSLR